MAKGRSVPDRRQQGLQSIQRTEPRSVPNWGSLTPKEPAQLNAIDYSISLFGSYQTGLLLGLASAQREALDRRTGYD